MIRHVFRLTCFKYLKRLKNCLEFKLYGQSSTGQWYWHVTSSSFFKISFLLWCLDKCMSKLPLFLNTLTHPSSGQLIFVLITHNSDDGGHILITLILSFKYLSYHTHRHRSSQRCPTVQQASHSVANMYDRTLSRRLSRKHCLWRHCELQWRTYKTEAML